MYQASIDRLVVFVVADSYQLCDVFWDGTQWVWEDQGAPPNVNGIGSPSAVYQASIDRLVVFVVGFDSHLYDKFWDGTQWVWEDQGIPPDDPAGFIPREGSGQALVPTLSAIYQTSIDRLVVFALGANGPEYGDAGNLYDKFWDGTQWVWEDQHSPQGVLELDSLSAVYQASIDRLIVFTVGETTYPNVGHLYLKFWNGGEWVWEDQGTPPNVNGMVTR